jgi:hypothetical protein
MSVLNQMKDWLHRSAKDMSKDAARKVYAELGVSEPEYYNVIPCRTLKQVTFKGKPRMLGYGATEGSRADGFCDEGVIWLRADCVKPKRVIEVLIHECTHAQFPRLSESVVQDFGEKVAAVIDAVFKDRGVRIGKLKPFKYKKVNGKLAVKYPAQLK